MPVDLHTHSNASDGTDRPEVVVRLAVAANLTAIALTDHDTLSGLDEGRAAAERAGVRFIPGVELSVDHEGLKIHMLAYWIEPIDGPLQDRLAWLRAGRDERNREILERLRALGHPVTLDEVMAHAQGEAVGRPHIADALVARGDAADRSDAFRRFLADGGPAYVERVRLTASEAIDLTRSSGGVTAIAHPATIGLDAAGYGRLFPQLAGIGLGGIEAYYPEHPPELRTHLAGIAASLGLAATGGSDYHGSGKPGISIGTGRGDLVVPDDAVDGLLAHRPDLGAR